MTRGKRGRPTRRDLLAVVTSLQGLVGAASAVKNDRNPDREAQTSQYLDQALRLCIAARSFDPPEAGSRSVWNEEPEPPRC